MHKSESSFLGEKTFKELYFEHHPMLFRVATYVLKGEAQAEDVVHDTFLKVWAQSAQLRHVQNWKAYLTLMVRNAAFDHLKKMKKEEELTLHLAVENHDGEPELLDDGFRKALEAAVSELPPKCRLIFSLSRFEGLSNAEIAEYLDISKRTVETQISIAFKAFRGELRPIFEAYLPSLASGILSLLLQNL